MEPKKRTPSQNGKRSRRKGHAAERELRDLLRRVWPECDRNIAQVRTGKKEGADILGTGDYHFESKCGARPNAWAALKQAHADNGDSDDFVVAALKKDREDWIVAMRMDSFLWLVECYESFRKAARR